MQQPTQSRLRRRAKKALAAAAVGGMALANAACSTTPTTGLDTGLQSRPLVERGTQLEKYRAAEMGYTLGAVYVGENSQRVVLRRIDHETPGQIRWGFNNYGQFTDEGTYRVVGSREGCWMTRRAIFVDLETRVEFTARVARPHLMDEWNCKRISGTWGPLRDGIQGMRDGIRSITPGAGTGPYYGGYGSRGTPEPYSGGSYPVRRYGW